MVCRWQSAIAVSECGNLLHSFVDLVGVVCVKPQIAIPPGFAMACVINNLTIVHNYFLCRMSFEHEYWDRTRIWKFMFTLLNRVFSRNRAKAPSKPFWPASFASFLCFSRKSCSKHLDIDRFVFLCMNSLRHILMLCLRHFVTLSLRHFTKMLVQPCTIPSLPWRNRPHKENAITKSNVGGPPSFLQLLNTDYGVSVLGGPLSVMKVPCWAASKFKPTSYNTTLFIH